MAGLRAASRVTTNTTSRTAARSKSARAYSPARQQLITTQVRRASFQHKPTQLMSADGQHAEPGHSQFLMEPHEMEFLGQHLNAQAQASLQKFYLDNYGATGRMRSETQVPVGHSDLPHAPIVSQNEEVARSGETYTNVTRPADSLFSTLYTTGMTSAKLGTLSPPMLKELAIVMNDYTRHNYSLAGKTKTQPDGVTPHAPNCVDFVNDVVKRWLPLVPGDAAAKSACLQQMNAATRPQDQAAVIEKFFQRGSDGGVKFVVPPDGYTL